MPWRVRSKMRLALTGAGWASALLVLTIAPDWALSSSASHSQAMVDLVAKVIPTVVSVEAHRLAPPSNVDPNQAAMFTRIKESVGSGFVVDPSGYIATNRHVVDDAYEITVTFSDGRRREAKLTFKSAVVDLAFLKVETDQPLPAATLAANQKVSIGERVLAVGNPLGLGISVSAGIVSALDRNIKESPYDAFIQTDAAINHGSSGGPLFNEDGEVIGINTALFTSVDNGGSQGLGFAIPGRDIIFLIDEIKRYKSVRVGWLGLNTQKLTPDMAEAMGYPDVYGAIVATVAPASPAAEVGIRSGDIIQTFNDKPIVDTTTLARATALSLGQHVTLRVWRNGASLDMPIELREAAESHGMVLADGASMGPRFASAADLGITLAPIDNDLRRRFALQPSAEGLLVVNVSNGSAAQEAGILSGDMMVSAQMIPTMTLESFDALIKDQVKKGRHRIIILVKAAGGERWVALPLRM